MGSTRFIHVYFVISFTLLSCVTAQWDIESEDTCRTPEGRNGICTEIKNCSFIVNTLQNAPKPLGRPIITLVQSYQCGFVGNQPKVCCPPNPSTDTSTTDTQKPPDVSKHANLNMINEENCGIVLENKIIGGNKTRLFQFPWMALLAYQTSAGLAFRCGGSLISARYVLTAAHCITNLGTLKLAGVRLGEYDIKNSTDCEIHAGEEVCSPPHKDFEIAEVIPHSQYSPTKYDNDVGLLRLGELADISLDNMKPVCLPTGPSRNLNLNGKQMEVTGWGATETGYSSSVLLHVAIPVVTNSECNKRYNRSNVRIGFRQMCAGGVMGKDSCSGDSGGPLQSIGAINGDVRFIQHGIVSFGPKFCGSEGQPGVYTRIAFYMDWILDNLKA